MRVRHGVVHAIGSRFSQPKQEQILVPLRAPRFSERDHNGGPQIERDPNKIESHEYSYL